VLNKIENNNNFLFDAQELKFFCWNLNVMSKLSIMLEGVSQTVQTCYFKWRNFLELFMWRNIESLNEKSLLCNFINPLSAKSESDLMRVCASPSGFAVPYHFSISIVVPLSDRLGFHVLYISYTSDTWRVK